MHTFLSVVLLLLFSCVAIAGGVPGKTTKTPMKCDRGEWSYYIKDGMVYQYWKCIYHTPLSGAPLRKKSNRIDIPKPTLSEVKTVPSIIKRDGPKLVEEHPFPAMPTNKYRWGPRR